MEPILDDSARVADVLTHELIHAALPEGEKHGPNFRRAMKALGLEGKATATVAGDGWREWALPIIEQLGRFPGAALHARKVGGSPAQKNRQLKLACEDCGFICRAAKSHIEAHEHLICPTGCGGLLERA